MGKPDWTIPHLGRFLRVLTVLLLALAVFATIARAMPEPVPPMVPQKIHQYAQGVAKKYKLDWGWFYRLIDAESGWQLYLPGGDGGKAYGLGQIHINTARAWGGLRGSDSAIAKRLLLPRGNLDACGRILRYLLKRYGGNKLFVTMAYNGGTKHVTYVQTVTGIK